MYKIICKKIRINYYREKTKNKKVILYKKMISKIKLSLKHQIYEIKNTKQIENKIQKCSKSKYEFYQINNENKLTKFKWK